MSSEERANEPTPERRPNEPARDYGDSAGYGSGGSTKDYHEVGDDNASPVKNRRNPLDDVVKIKPA